MQLGLRIWVRYCFRFAGRRSYFLPYGPCRVQLVRAMVSRTIHAAHHQPRQRRNANRIMETGILPQEHRLYIDNFSKAEDRTILVLTPVRRPYISVRKLPGCCCLQLAPPIHRYSGYLYGADSVSL
jgi:hypothetical protein